MHSIYICRALIYHFKFFGIKHQLKHFLTSFVVVVVQCTFIRLFTIFMLNWKKVVFCLEVIDTANQWVAYFSKVQATNAYLRFKLLMIVKLSFWENWDNLASLTDKNIKMKDIPTIIRVQIEGRQLLKTLKSHFQWVPWYYVCTTWYQIQW